MLGSGMCPIRTIALEVAALACLLSCGGPEIHLHDRHSLSYPPVAAYAKAHPGTTLVLFDYHHDLGPVDHGVLSSNWVAALLSQGLVSRVLWVSGRDLAPSDRSARMAWLRQKLSSFSPREASALAGRVSLADWHDLAETSLDAPLVVSLDLDILFHDPGASPEDFLGEIVAWVGRRRPALLTLCLSAAYDGDAAAAWTWFDAFARGFGASMRDARWFLEAGPHDARPEGAEEGLSWRRWEEKADSFQRGGEAFWPAAGIWASPPARLRSTLLGLGLRAGDASARAAIAGWRDEDFLALEKAYPSERIEGLLAAAAASLEAAWRGESLPTPEREAGGPSLAIRISREGGERGNFYLGGNLSDPTAAVGYCAQRAAEDPRNLPVTADERSRLSLELCLFGPWRRMDDPLDFRPGIDSLLLEDGEEMTLLGAPLAIEGALAREAFLGRLSTRAGLGFQGWKRTGLVFLRSATLWSRRSLGSLIPLEPEQPHL